MSSEDPNNLTSPREKCSDCQEMVTCLFLKFHKAGVVQGVKRRRKYTDESGRLWHGTRCPSCAVKMRKAQTDSKAQSKKDELKKQLEE